MSDWNVGCALTGHREFLSGEEQSRLFEKLRSLILGGCDGFLCGMASGFDLAAMEYLIRLKREHPLFLEACLPYEGYLERLSVQMRRKCEVLLEGCDRQTVLSPCYEKGCFLARDRYMVERADLVLAYFRQQKSGTAYTVHYALSRGATVLYL